MNLFIFIQTEQEKKTYYVTTSTKDVMNKDQAVSRLNLFTHSTHAALLGVHFKHKHMMT